MEQQSVSDAIRYVLIGFVGFFCYAFLFPDEAKKLSTDLGGIPLTGSAMAGGAVFYFLYDALVLPCIHWIKDTVGTPESNYRVRLRHKFPEYELTSGEAEDVYVSLLRNRVAWKDVPEDRKSTRLNSSHG